MEKELIRFFLQYLLTHHFESKADMARQLDVNSRTIQRTFEMLDNDHAKGGSIVVDKALWFCAQHQFSLDDLFSSYYQAQNPQGKEIIDMIHQEESNRPAYSQLTLAKLLGLTEKGEQAYQNALAFVQKASTYLCPHCASWCEPWNTNSNETTQTCLIGHMASVLLADVQNLHTQK